MNTNRLTFIDIARAICIILIVIYHYNPSNAPDWYLILNNIGVNFRIPLLMFISGYIYSMTKKPITYRKFIFNKFKRLIVPYFFVSTFIICTKLLTDKNMYVENPVSLFSFYEMFYFPSAGFFTWFIYVLFLIFLIIPFINTPQKLNISLIISFLLLLIPVKSVQLFYLVQLKEYLFYFVLGCFIYAKPGIKLIIDKIPTVVFLAFFVSLYGLKFIIHVWFIPLMNFSLAVTGIFFILNISMQIDKGMNPIKRFFLRLAPYSYTIYLFHTTAEGFAKSVFLKMPIENYLTPDFFYILKALLIIISGVFVPIVLHKTVVSKSMLFSFLTGAKYLPKRYKEVS